MGTLKVLQLSSERSWRGGEQQIAYLADYLRTQGVEVHVAARRHSAFSTWCRQLNYPLMDASFSNGLDVATALKILQYVRHHGIHLVHAHSGKSHSIAHLAARLGMRQALVVHRRVDFPLNGGMVRLSKYNHPALQRIVCVSEAIASEVKKRIRQPERVCTVYDGIDFGRFSERKANGYLHQELGIEPHKKLIVMVAALAPHKDYPTFLKVAHKVLAQRNDVHFVAVGEGTLRNELMQMVAQLDIRQGFSLTGFRRDVPEVLREASLFMLTSKTEGLGSSIIDAMYNGVPVVATRAGGIPELLQDGVQGHLCRVGDVQCLSGKITQLLDDADHYSSCSREARSRAEQFSAAHMGADVLRVYKELRL